MTPQLPVVVLAGRPNVGKSTLFNRLVGGHRAIVHDQPGVTRDRQEGLVDWEGIRFRLVDMGGMVPFGADPLQEKVTRQSLKGIEQADLLLVMMDGREGVTPVDSDLVDLLRPTEKPKMYLVNKVDSTHLESGLADFYRLGVEPLVPLSAETGRGVGELLDRIIQTIRTCFKTLGVPEPGSREALTVAIIGRPNVGKSTLTNRLLAEERMVTDDRPGTTRDSIDIPWILGGRKLSLIDTAGIRRRGRIELSVEKFSVIKALKIIDRADLLLVVLDGREGITDQDAHLVGEVFNRKRGAILLVNKWDLARNTTTKEKFRCELERHLRFVPFYPFLYISAKTGFGLEKIAPLVLEIETQYNRWIPGEKLKEQFARMIAATPLPTYRGKGIRIFSMTQRGTRPPEFLIFTNEPRHIHFSYERYLVNALREAFGFDRVPIRLRFMKKEG